MCVEKPPSECHLSGVRGKFHRLVGRFRDVKSKRSHEKRKWKDGSLVRQKESIQQPQTSKLTTEVPLGVLVAKIQQPQNLVMATSDCLDDRQKADKRKRDRRRQQGYRPTWSRPRSTWSAEAESPVTARVADQTGQDFMVVVSCNQCRGIKPEETAEDEIGLIALNTNSKTKEEDFTSDMLLLERMPCGADKQGLLREQIIRASGHVVVITDARLLKIRSVPQRTRDTEHKYNVNLMETTINHFMAKASDDFVRNGKTTSWRAETAESLTAGPDKENTPDKEPKDDGSNVSSEETPVGATTELTRTHSDISFTSKRRAESYHPIPPAISGLGFCHRWNLKNILQDVDEKFPPDFATTNWAKSLIRKRQVTFKIESGVYQLAGEGAYGSVFRCTLRKSRRDEKAVIKFLTRENSRCSNVLREAKLTEMLRKTCGHFVPRFLGVVFVKPNPEYLEWALVCEDIYDMSFGQHGNTLQGAYNFHIEILTERANGDSEETLPISEQEWVKVVRDCARGLAYIHKAGVILNDLKPSNVLLKRRDVRDMGPDTSAWRVTHIDFGLASYGPRGEVIERTDLEYLRENCWHLAPEMTRGSLSTFKSDVYSFGILVMPIIQMFNHVGLKRMRRACLRHDVVSRPTAAELVDRLDMLVVTGQEETGTRGEL